MATDDKNNDPEQDDFFGDDDDDFGLPELEYEALDDDSDSSSDDEEMPDDDLDMSDDEDMSTEEEVDFDSSDDEDVSDDLDIPDDFDDEEEIPDMISDEELEAAMDDEISDEELNEFYEEESFDDFESSDSSDMGGETDSIFDSDGMDSDEFKDFEKGLDTPAPAKPKYVDTSAYSSGSGNQDAKGKFTRIVIIAIVLFVSAGAVFLYLNNFFGEEEKPVAAKVVKKPVAKKSEPKPVEKKEEPKEEPKPVQAAPKKAKPSPSTPGTVNALAERTGNTHVVIASFLDEDMAVDYANELAAAGKSPSIIPPFGNAKTTRVAISSYPSLADAQGNVESFKAEYGPSVWLLKY